MHDDLPPAHAREVTFFGQLFGGFAAVLLVQVVGLVRGFEIIGESHAAAGLLARAQGFELVASLGDQLVFIGAKRAGVGAGGGFGHSRLL